MKNLLIFGASGHAKVVINTVERSGRYRIVGLVESFRPRGREFFGYAVLGSEDDLPGILREYGVSDMAIAVGDNFDRHALYRKITAIVPECEFPAILHPDLERARGVSIGKGSVVLGGVTLNSDATIGDFCIVDNQTNIGHDAVIENFASIAPNSSIGGDAVVRPFTAIGMGANVVEKNEIGEHTVVGAGSTVVKSLPGHVVAWGTPARVVRERKAGEKYLK